MRLLRCSYRNTNKKLIIEAICSHSALESGAPICLDRAEKRGRRGKEREAAGSKKGKKRRQNEGKEKGKREVGGSKYEGKGNEGGKDEMIKR